MSATTSHAFRSWLLWGSAGAGVVYGFVRNARLSSTESAKREAAAKHRAQANFEAARAAYAAKQAAAEAAKVKRSGAAGVVSDPDAPNFDLEKLINHWAGEKAAAH
ncbi:hypothetical protein BC828DRAFT_387345 [Blastocladiella britannica]|nr:hypothetical protein BC828DRAFT_387345 [Blastocladiella britannica]